jgi:hypothetical protein
MTTTRFKSEAKNLIRKNHPIVAFTRMGIDEGWSKTEIYDRARASGIKVRKQNALGLYDYLIEQPRVFVYRDTGDYMGVTLYFVEKKPLYGFFAGIQEFFIEMCETFLGMTYEPSGLSEGTVDDIIAVSDVSGRDFVFEIGDLGTGTIRYWGHWHRRQWSSLRIFPEFETPVLSELLRERDNSQEE